MARIRSIKPTFWTSGQVMECSHSARLLFIGMWNFADDYGNIPGKVRELKARIFPGDDITQTEVFNLVRELSRNGLVQIYVVEEQEYLHVTGWHHQRIDKRQSAKCPNPLQDNSQTIPGLLPPDTKLREGILEEGSKGAIVEYSKIEEANKLLEQIIEITNADPVKSPGWMSAGTIMSWLNEGIDADTIINTVRDVMARRGDKPPGSPSYFTSAIREAAADQSGGSGFGAPGTGWSQAKWCQ